MHRWTPGGWLRPWLHDHYTCFDRLSMRMSFSWHLPTDEPHPEPPHAELVEARRMRRPRRLPKTIGRRGTAAPAPCVNSSSALDAGLQLRLEGVDVTLVD